ncbi:IS256 family transposase [Streptomyces sp. NPDC048680]|uniref:IS256 family transposase n=1 Tax=Streptomyces sp. NPDC048680 TaxID=3155492 RepID=UPI00342EBEFD
MSTTTGHLIETVDGVSLAEAGDGVEGADVKSMPVSQNGLSSELLEELAALVAEKVRGEGLRLMGEGGVLPELAQHLMQSALEAEMDQHLAEGAGRGGGRGSRSGGNTRNGYRSKKVMTEVGAVTVQVPRDRLGTFQPRLLPKYARRTGALDDLVMSLTAKGLTSGEIVSHLAQTYGMTTTKETISTITDKALESMAEWRTRPLDAVYPVVFIDAVHVKICDGHVANRPVYVAIAVTADGYREILGLWAGDGGEGAKYWQTVLTEIKNRGVRDVLMLVCDGLSALPDAVNAVWSRTVVQTCVVHLLRASLRYASRRDWADVARDLKPVYTARCDAGSTSTESARLHQEEPCPLRHVTAHLSRTTLRALQQSIPAPNDVGACAYAPERLPTRAPAPTDQPNSECRTTDIRPAAGEKDPHAPEPPYRHRHRCRGRVHRRAARRRCGQRLRRTFQAAGRLQR